MSYLPIGPRAKESSVSVVRTAEEVAPAAKNSVTAWADVPLSILDTLYFGSVSYTCKNTGSETICWKVIASNDAAFVVEVEVQASADLATTATGSYSATVAPWRYYKVMLQDKVGGVHGQATVRGVAK